MTTNTAPASSRDADTSRNLVGYFLGAYLLTWVFWVPAVLADAEQLTLPLPSFAFLALGGLGPMLAAILMTTYRSRTSGVRKLFGQLKRWQISPLWYAAALLGIPAIGLAAGIHVALDGTLATRNVSAILASLPVQFVFLWWAFGGDASEGTPFNAAGTLLFSFTYLWIGANALRGVKDQRSFG